MKNLVKERWYNPFTAITEKGEALEVNNILIYNENGILFETGQGWFKTPFSNNNEIEDQYIGEIKRKLKIDFSKKENFCIKSSCDWKSNSVYDLYIYYTNINYKFQKLELTGYWLEIRSTILEGIQIEETIGQRQKFVDDEKYSKNLDEAIKKITIFNLTSHPEEVKNSLKIIQKAMKKIEVLQQEANTFTVEDWRKLLFEHKKEEIIKIVENNQKLEG